MKRMLSLLLISAIVFSLTSCITKINVNSSSGSEKESSQMISSSVSENSASESSSQPVSRPESSAQSSSGSTSQPGTASSSSSSPKTSSASSSRPVSSSQAPASSEEEAVNTGILKFHAISCIERGDALLIQTPWGKNILIDAGKKVSGNQVVGYLKEQGVKKIDALIATHYHEDHTGGMGAVLDNFTVGRLYVPNIDLTRAAWGTLDYNNFRNYYKNRDIQTGNLTAGSKLELDPLVKVEVLAPKESFYDFAGQRFENDINNNLSIVIKVTFDKVSFLLMGDALIDCENTMMSAGYDLKANVLKTGHHGNADATGAEFLNAVQPEYGISCREVPYPQIASRLQAAGAQSLDTSSQNIVFTTDGTTLTVTTTPRTTYD